MCRNLLGRQVRERTALLELEGGAAHPNGASNEVIGLGTVVIGHLIRDRSNSSLI